MTAISALSRWLQTAILRRGQDDEGGQGLAEYALILGLIAAVCVGALSGLGSAIAGSSGFQLF